MPTHVEKRHLPYTKEQIYGVVADVERYPEFLPWCSACRIRKRESDGRTFYADMVVSFKMFRERFTSKVTPHPTELIEVEYIDGPFRYLINRWHFADAKDGGCILDFYIDFEFRSRILQKVIGLVFSEAVQRMVRAFELRLRTLYGADGRGKPVQAAVA
jgi:coenzyme Q-binding protein COQ10